MFVLDTNVVSELVRPAPNPAVYSWIHCLKKESLFFSAVGEAELRYGVAIMPDGHSKDLLVSKIDRLVQETFAERILPFDPAAASIFARLAAARRAAGLAVALADIQIAAIAQSCGMSVATRDTKDFAGMGLEIINPWTDA